LYALNGLAVTPSGTFLVDKTSSAAIGTGVISACSTVSPHDSALTNDCADDRGLGQRRHAGRKRRHLHVVQAAAGTAGHLCVLDEP
jgi:hypothetical protein